MLSDRENNEKAFVDTNILLYAFDKDVPDKRGLEDTLISSLLSANQMVLSSQVLNEFFWTATRPYKSFTLLPEEVHLHLTRLTSLCSVVSLTPHLTFEAITAVKKHKLSFWDALIWAAAKISGSRIIYSEDMNHNQEIEGIIIKNPFLV
ncbi:MAG: PIN domain-containing protein [Fimbriimonadia bacterium]|nr:PIN domain-containing protein [Fimbriimonadia bacterium]